MIKQVYKSMEIHEISNSMIFLNFKASLVIDPPLSVIMTHCVQNQYVTHLL